MDNHSNTSNNGNDASNGEAVPISGPVTASPQSIRLFGQTISAPMPILNGHEVRSIGHDLHPSNPAPVLRQQEVAVNDVIENGNAPNTESEEGRLEVIDQGGVLVNAIVHGPAGRRLIFYGVTLEEVAGFHNMARRLVTRALTPTQIGESLNISSYNGTRGNHDACSICLEEFCHGEEVASLHCNHVFHTQCITQWLNRSNRCPNCNAEAHNLGW